MNQRSLSLNNLPDDCLFQIINYLPGLWTKLKLKCVCQKFFQVVTDYLSSHSFSINFDDGETISLSEKPIPLEKLITICPKITKLNLCQNNCSISDQIAEVKCMPLLSDLSLHLFKLKPTNFQFETFLKKCPNLKKLTLVEYECFEKEDYNFDCLSKKLSYLKIDSIAFEPFQKLIKKIGGQLIKLGVEFFELKNYLQLNQIIFDISKYCDNLKELEIYVSYVEGTLLSLPKLKNLENLKIEFPDHHISYKLIEDMLKSMPNLKTIHFYFRVSPDHNEILKLCSQYCLNIEKISNYRVFGSEIITKDGLMDWKKLKKLKSFFGQNFEYWQKRCNLK